MNPIDSSKKWILNKLMPLIEKQGQSSSSEDTPIKDGESEPSHSASSKQNKNEQYSDLLEDSEYT